jgi:hypothetical protein
MSVHHTWLSSSALTEGTERLNNVVVAKKAKNIIPHIKEDLEQNIYAITNGGKCSSVVVIDQK